MARQMPGDQTAAVRELCSRWPPARTLSARWPRSMAQTVSIPVSRLIADANGNLYGTASGYPDNGYDSVFEVAAGTHALTTLATFDNTINPIGNQPSVWLADASGNLYGTTQNGGDLTVRNGLGGGTVFKVDTRTNTLTTLVTFHNTDGSTPKCLLADASGNLYGVASWGGDLTLKNGYGYGTVFKVEAGTHALTTLVTFNGANGDYPIELIADTSGNLYGITQGGGAYGNGTVFELSPVPEPSTLALAGCSVAAVVVVARQRRLKRQNSVRHEP